ncbi:MAG: hypothetical protein ACTSU2_16910 [Promethearchaeota archaeon]
MDDLSDMKIDKYYQTWPFSYEELIQDFLSERDCLQRCFEKYTSGEGINFLKLTKKIFESLRITKICFVGNTYSYFASFIGSYLFRRSKRGDPLGVCWDNYEMSEFYDYFIPFENNEDILYIFISRSGQSRLLKRILGEMNLIKINPKQIWLITNATEQFISNIDEKTSDSEGDNIIDGNGNNDKSTEILSKYCGLIFPIFSDKELVIGTKSYINTIYVLYLIIKTLMGEIKFDIGATDENNEDKQRSMVQEGKSEKKDHSDIYKILNNLDVVIKNWETISDRILDFIGMNPNFIYFISRGASLSTAYHAALSAKSYTRFFAEGISLGLFFHGPFQIINKDFKCILIIGDQIGDESNSMLLRLIKLIINKLGMGKIVLLTNNQIILDQLEDRNKNLIKIVDFKCQESALSPILESFVLQMVLLKIAKKKGLIKKK